MACRTVGSLTKIRKIFVTKGIAYSISQYLCANIQTFGGSYRKPPIIRRGFKRYHKHFLIGLIIHARVGLDTILINLYSGGRLIFRFV